MVYLTHEKLNVAFPIFLLRDVEISANYPLGLSIGTRTCCFYSANVSNVTTVAWKDPKFTFACAAPAYSV
jgi:hypothetical protein